MFSNLFGFVAVNSGRIRGIHYFIFFLEESLPHERWANRVAATLCNKEFRSAIKIVRHSNAIDIDVVACRKSPVN